MSFRFGSTALVLLLISGCSSTESGPNTDDHGSMGGESSASGGFPSQASGGSSGGTDHSSGGTGGGEPNPDLYDCTPSPERENYQVKMNIPPRKTAPGGLPKVDTPLFVSIGWDDNPQGSGMQWAIDEQVSQGVGSTFFHTTNYLSAAQSQWIAAKNAGFEVANHTVSHNTSAQSSATDWLNEIQGAHQSLTRAEAQGGVGASQVIGFRAPYLAYNDALFGALVSAGYIYDSTLQEGFDPEIDGTNHYFPYTLDTGSPGHDFNRSFGFESAQFDFTPRPGLVEMPVYALIVPDDTLAAEYGFSAGLRERARAAMSTQVGSQAATDYVNSGYKITGFDYNLWSQAQLTPAEFLAVLKYNFDLRRQGNRVPFLFGAHTADYANNQGRRQAIADFLTYVRTFSEVRVVSYQEVLHFMRDPKALDCY